MRPFDPIVQSFMGSVIHIQYELAQGGTVAAQLIRHYDPRLPPAGYQSGDEPFCRASISTCLHQDVENLAIAIHGAPQPVLHTADHNHNFIQMPFVRRLLARRPDALCNLSSEFSDPYPDRFITHYDASFSEQILDVAQTERKTMIRPDCVRNDRTWEAVAFQAKLGNLADHQQALRTIGTVVNNLTIPPDGFFLMLGTLFASTQDRDAPSAGFTHKIGDIVEIANPMLGRLVNTVRLSTDCPPWVFGTSALMKNLAERHLI